MSQLIIKPFVLRNVLRHTRTNNYVRMFSYSRFPFMMIDYLVNFLPSQDDGPATKLSESMYPNDCKQKEILIRDGILESEVRSAMRFGFSRNGSLVFNSYSSANFDDKSVGIFVSHKPSNPKLTDVDAFLPPLPPGTKVQNIAMSYFSDRDKNWVVCAKLPLSQLILCRPFGDNKWIHLKPMHESINSFSSVMFSKKDQRFYIPSPGGKHLCSLDLHFKESDQPRLIRIRFEDFPKSAVSELEMLSSCSMTSHIVESPTGQLFLVKWYGEDYEDKDLEEDENFNEVVRSVMHKTKMFMVFREKENPEAWAKDDKTMIYTEDIGDFCIFLGHSQACCVPASSSPGLKPNCIYFVGYSSGVYDLTTKTCTTFLTKETFGKDKAIVPLRGLGFPYWPPPLPLY